MTYHLLYVLFSRRGYWEFRQLLPGLQDGADIVQMLRFYFGLSPVPALFGRYNFIEKFEYLAGGLGVGGDDRHRRPALDAAGSA